VIVPDFGERTHQTMVGSSLSSTVELISGVVQGSGIGPLMFLVLINELAEILDLAGVKVELFAKDIKVYVQIVFPILHHFLNVLTLLIIYVFTICMLV